MKSFIRDSTVLIAVKFYDTDGNVTSPAAATVTLGYTANGRKTHETYDLVVNYNVWSYSWDSRVADEGAVYGHAQTTGAAPVSSVDFEFRLTANRANKDANCAA
jgi:hypothetical protein